MYAVMGYGSTGWWSGILSLLLFVFMIAMAVDVVKRGQNYFWLWIILFFPPFGAIIYFLTEFRSSGFRFRIRLNRVTAEELRIAEADARRLDNAACWHKFIALLIAKKDYERAWDTVRDPLARFGDDVYLLYDAAQIAEARGDWSAAAEHLSRVVGIDRGHDSHRALARFAVVTAELGKLVEADALFEELLGKSHRAEHIHARAEHLLRMKRDDDAAAHFKRIIDEADYVPAYLKHEVRPWVRKARAALKRLGR